MEALRGSPDFEVVGIVEPDPVRRARAEQTKTYADLTWMTEEQLLNAPGLQAVAVETVAVETRASRLYVLGKGGPCIDTGPIFWMALSQSLCFPIFCHSERIYFIVQHRGDR